MTKNDFSIHKLTYFLLISIICNVYSLPASSEESSVTEYKLSSEDIGVEQKALDNNNQPIYEFQLAVWPDEYLGNGQNAMQNYADSSYAPQFEEQQIVYPAENSDSHFIASIPTWQNEQNWQSTAKPSTVASDLIAAVFPEIHFDESFADHDHVDLDDDDVDHSLLENVGVSQKPNVPKPHVEVVEQYQMVHPNGTTEYKLVLSNGMTNYKKIYNKLLLNGKVVTVQEGYDSVPIPGDDPYSNEFQTQFYIADEHGHNVYRVEKHTRKPELPEHLDYNLQHGNL